MVIEMIFWIMVITGGIVWILVLSYVLGLITTIFYVYLVRFIIYIKKQLHKS